MIERCPKCDRPVAFHIEKAESENIAVHAVCPGCGRQSSVYHVSSVDDVELAQRSCIREMSIERRRNTAEKDFEAITYKMADHIDDMMRDVCNEVGCSDCPFSTSHHTERDRTYFQIGASCAYKGDVQAICDKLRGFILNVSA